MIREPFIKDGEVMTNSLGYKQVISTLTSIAAQVSKQKFYQIPIADYMPVLVGKSGYALDILNWRTFSDGEDFDTGIMQNAGNKNKIPEVDAIMDSVTQTVYPWAKGISYTIFQVEQAALAGSFFSLIEAKEISRKTNWDLGIQKKAFFGYGTSKGLLNQASVVADTTTISERLNGMSASELNTFVGAILGVYRTNCNYTAWPTHFVIPETDWNGLGQFPDATFPIKSRLVILEEAFKTMTMNPNFKILPLAYCDKVNFDSTNNLYLLYNSDPTTLKFDIPLDYQMSTTASINGFQWANVAWGSFAPLALLRPKELMYFTNTAT